MNNFEKLKVNFLSDIKTAVLMEEIPPPLILNFKNVHVLSWMVVKEGAKKISISGIEDKHQITGVFAITLDGEFFLPQLIYQGTMAACLPGTKFPANWHITCSPNHWANEVTTKEYI